MRHLTLTGYRWLTIALCPVLLVWDTWRALKQPIYRAHRHERWAIHLPSPLSKSMIWVHAVSVGETQACAPLVRAILTLNPEYTVLLTHMTPTGRDTGAALFASDIAQHRLQQCYLPYDMWGVSQCFFSHFNPAAGMVMETEIWPNTVATCHDRRIPIGLANARMSEKTLRKTLRLKRLAQTTFNRFAWVAAQSVADAQRLAQLRSAPIVVTGNVKFDVSPDAAQLAQGQVFKSVQNRLIIALASTREGEEALLLDALLPLLSQNSQSNSLPTDHANKHTHQSGSSAENGSALSPPPLPPLLVLIPRHPKRIDEIMQLLSQRKLRCARRSLGQIVSADTQVYVGDTLGEMWFYYGASDIAVMGGGWLPHGGQNLIEPCMAGCAVVVGPQMFNFAHATEMAVQAQAVVQCASVQHLKDAIIALLPAQARQSLAHRAKDFAQAHGGATQAHLRLLDSTV